MIEELSITDVGAPQSKSLSLSPPGSLPSSSFIPSLTRPKLGRNSSGSKRKELVSSTLGKNVGHRLVALSASSSLANPESVTNLAARTKSMSAEKLATRLATWAESQRRTSEGKDLGVEIDTAARTPLLPIDTRSISTYLSPTGRIMGSINVNFPSLLVKRFRRGNTQSFHLESFITTEAGKRHFRQLTQSHPLSSTDIVVIDDVLDQDEIERDPSRVAGTGVIVLGLLQRMLEQDEMWKGTISYLSGTCPSLAQSGPLNEFLRVGEEDPHDGPNSQAVSLSASSTSSATAMTLRKDGERVIGGLSRTNPDPGRRHGLSQLQAPQRDDGLPKIDDDSPSPPSSSFPSTSQHGQGSTSRATTPAPVDASFYPSPTSSSSASSNATITSLHSACSTGTATPTAPESSFNDSNINANDIATMTTHRKARPPKLRRIDTSESLLGQTARNGTGTLRHRANSTAVDVSLNGSMGNNAMVVPRPQGPGLLDITTAYNTALPLDMSSTLALHSSRSPCSTTSTTLSTRSSLNGPNHIAFTPISPSPSTTHSSLHSSCSDSSGSGGGGHGSSTSSRSNSSTSSTGGYSSSSCTSSSSSGRGRGCGGGSRHDSPLTAGLTDTSFSCSEIIPGFLFLGSEPCCEDDFDHLHECGIMRVLNMAMECVEEEEECHRRFTKYRHIPMRDFVEEVGVQDRIREANVWLDDAFLHSQPVYVHCKAGKSRSVLIVLAYLIHRFRWSLKKSYAHISDRRKGICPNIGFLAELMTFEERELGGRSSGVVSTASTPATTTPSLMNRHQSYFTESNPATTTTTSRDSSMSSSMYMDDKTPRFLNYPTPPHGTTPLSSSPPTLVPLVVSEPDRMDDVSYGAPTSSFGHEDNFHHSYHCDSLPILPSASSSASLSSSSSSSSASPWWVPSCGMGGPLAPFSSAYTREVYDRQNRTWRVARQDPSSDRFTPVRRVSKAGLESTY